MTYNPNSRFKLVDAPILAPGEDFITRTINGPFIDTGTDLGFGQKGRVYLSVDTLREMADTAGLLDTADSQKVNYDAAYKQGYADAMREKLDDKLRDDIDELLHILRSDNPAPALGVVEEGDSVGDAAEGAEPEPSGEDGGAGDSDGSSIDGVVEGGDEAPEPDVAPSRKGNGAGGKQRRANVPSGSSNGANPFRL